MKHLLLFFLSTSLMLSCQNEPKFIIPAWEAFDESALLEANKDHENPRLQYKLLQSKVSDRNELWASVQDQLSDFGEEDYNKYHPFVFEKSIPQIQESIEKGDLSYRALTQWYLYRIVKYENNPETTLNAIISLNADAVEEAGALDHAKKTNKKHSIYGMPILLKDNINTEGMPTTAGAVALLNNHTSDAHIVERLKANDAIILGKVNLSEWAYFFCAGCPLGYSAVGGQTLNPYGPRAFETGGSSAASGVSMAANYATAAVGTETAGSILSPSAHNSLFGLKPTIGLLSRGGIVPISSSLDTPGPMTRTAIDNAILLSAMSGKDTRDAATNHEHHAVDYIGNIADLDLKKMRFGAFNNFLEDSLYANAIQNLKDKGVTIVELEPLEFDSEGFSRFLSADMRNDLSHYFRDYAGPDIIFKNIKEVIDFNLQDTTIRMPYGQSHFESTANEKMTDEEFAELKKRIFASAENFFNTPMEEHQLDAVLSINNWSAGSAAMARYPCLTVPMGYQETGEPRNLTFIARPWQEAKLLQMAHAFEREWPIRQFPKNYR